MVIRYFPESLFTYLGNIEQLFNKLFRTVYRDLKKAPNPPSLIHLS